MSRSRSLHQCPDSTPARAVRTACAAVFVSASLWLAGCGSADKEGSTPDTGTAASGTAAAEAEENNGAVHLEVVGGPHAGTYDARMTSGGCSYGLAGTGSWGNQHSIDASDPKTFSSLQLIVPDAKGAASGTSVFKITAGFGPIFGSGSTSYDIDTRPDANPKGGSGRVTVDDRGSSGRVTFDGKTADGIGLKGTIDCRKVTRVG